MSSYELASDGLNTLLQFSLAHTRNQVDRVTGNAGHLDSQERLYADGFARLRAAHDKLEPMAGGPGIVRFIARELWAPITVLAEATYRDPKGPDFLMAPDWARAILPDLPDDGRDDPEAYLERVLGLLDRHAWPAWEDLQARLDITVKPDATANPPTTTKAGIAILRLLEKERPLRLQLGVILAHRQDDVDLPISKDGVTEAVDALEKDGLAHRPDGPRSGVTITAAGQALLASLMPIR